MQTSPLWTGRWGVFSSACFRLLALMLIWALASPLGSVPDEPIHAIRAAAVFRAESISQQWAEHPSLAIAEVPRYIAQLRDRTCFAFRPQVSAACVVLPSGNPNEIVLTGTSAANNGPLLYALAGSTAAAFFALVWFASQPLLREVPRAGAGTSPAAAFVSTLARLFDFSSRVVRRSPASWSIGARPDRGGVSCGAGPVREHGVDASPLHGGGHGAFQSMILNPDWQPPFGLAVISLAMILWAAVEVTAVVRKLSSVQSIG